jgi:hypothetical protein
MIFYLIDLLIKTVAILGGTYAACVLICIAADLIREIRDTVINYIKWRRYGEY